MFLRYESFGQYIRRYPVTALLIAANLVMMLVMTVNGSSENNLTLLHYGAMFAIDGVAPEWWRYITAMFLHAGWTHFLFNMFALYVFAPPLERLLRPWRYAAFYLLSGLAGNIMSNLVRTDEYISVGASGAIYGVYAAYVFIALFRKHWMDESSRKMIQIIIVVGVLNSIVVPNIDIWAHLGGFAGGFALLGLILSRRNRPS